MVTLACCALTSTGCGSASFDVAAADDGSIVDTGGGASDTGGADGGVTSDSTIGDSSGTDTTSGDSAKADSLALDAISIDAISTDSIAGDSIKPDGAPLDTRGDAPKDGPVCDPASFPTFDKGCTIDDNCAFGLHQTDCCGNQVAIGFNHGEASKFSAAEAAYRTACPAACGCPMGPISTDTGAKTFDSSKIKVSCVGGRCLTDVP